MGKLGALARFLKTSEGKHASLGALVGGGAGVATEAADNDGDPDYLKSGLVGAGLGGLGGLAANSLKVQGKHANHLSGLEDRLTDVRHEAARGMTRGNVKAMIRKAMQGSEV